MISIGKIPARKFMRALTTTVLGLAVAFLSSCDREYLPKPLGYNRLELPCLTRHLFSGSLTPAD